LSENLVAQLLNIFLVVWSVFFTVIIFSQILLLNKDVFRRIQILRDPRTDPFEPL